MKKSFIFISLIAFLAMVSCVKDKLDNTDDGSLDNQDLVSQLFSAGMSAYTESNAKSATLKGTYPINVSVDYTAYGPLGGNIHVTGSITGSMSFNDYTYAITGGYLSLGLTETITDYAFSSNGNTYTINGAPYISLAGSFTIEADGTFGAASSMEMGGGVRVTGPNFDQTINIQLTIIINSDGSGGHVSGTIGGVSVNYTF